MSKELSVAEAHRLIPEINAHYREFRKSSKDAIENAIKIGKLLLDMKEALPHGEFVKAVDDRCDFEIRWGQICMKLADGLPPILKRIDKDEYPTSIHDGIKLISDNAPKPKAKSATIAHLEPARSTEPDGPGPDGDDPNEHCRPQIENERATGDINTPPPEPAEPDWKGLLQTIVEARRFADGVNVLTGRRGQFNDQFQTTCGILDDIVRDWRKVK